MALALPLTPRRGRAHRNRTVLRELSIAIDADLLTTLAIPEDLLPASQKRSAGSRADLRVAGWQRALGFTAALVVVCAMIIAPHQLLRILLYLCVGAAISLIALSVTHAAFVRARSGHPAAPRADRR